MPRPTVNLAAHLNRTVISGHPADFPVVLRPISYRSNGAYVAVPKRLAVVREDTGEPLALVSDRYTLVQHQAILDAVEAAITRLGLGGVPRGVYVDRRGARMRALYKFHHVSRPVRGTDTICPCVKVENTYDGTSRISAHIGAFRFVCTNLAVGGGGVFAGGFMAVHAGEIPIEALTDQLSTYLDGFSEITELYRTWAGMAFCGDEFQEILSPFPARTAEGIREAASRGPLQTVYDAYNAATWYATHRMRSARSALALLEQLNRRFQVQFPPSPN